MTTRYLTGVRDYIDGADYSDLDDVIDAHRCSRADGQRIYAGWMAACESDDRGDWAPSEGIEYFT